MQQEAAAAASLSEQPSSSVEPAGAENSTAADFNDKVRQLMEMGFKRSQAEGELSRMNGDFELALSNLLHRAANN